MTPEPITIYIAGVRRCLEAQPGLYDGQRFSDIEAFIRARGRRHEAEKEGVNILLERGRTPYDVLTKALVYLKSGDNK